MARYSRNHDEIVTAAKYGRSLESRSGNFWTVPGFTGNRGWMNTTLFYVIQRFGYRVDQSVYSYGTPIAVKIDGVWLRIDARYSATTSKQHQSRLWSLDYQWIPKDATFEDIERIVSGVMRYVPGYGDNVGRYVAAGK